MTEPEPPTSTPEEEAISLRRFRLLEAWRTSTPSWVDGILFKLACDVDKSEWGPLCLIGLYGDPTSNFGPELAFPWTPPHVREVLAQHEPLVEVTEGCCVFIGFVTDQPMATTFADFAHPGQREGKRAHLFVMRPSGDVDIVRRPLLLLRSSATDALLIARAYRAAFTGLTEQLQAKVGLPDIEEWADEPVEKWSNPPENIPPIYARALFALIEGHRTLDHEPYVAFGYLMAKAEAEAQLMESAAKGRQAAAIQTKAAGERRLKSRQETEKLRIIARQVIARNPDISLGKCAREVESIVAVDPSWTFKSDAKWVSGHIKELFELRANGREYRPIRPKPGGDNPGSSGDVQ